MAIRTLIFDFDGTLVDSEFAHEQATHRFLHTAKVSMPAGDFVGKGLKDFIYAIQEKYPQLPLSFEQLFALYEESFLEVAKQAVHPYQETIRLAKEAKAKGFKIAIASGTQLSLLVRLAEMFDLTDVFGEHIYSSDHDAAGKPAPDIFLRVSKLLGCDAKDVLVLEDSYPGYMAARNAQMHVCMMPDPRYSAGYDFNDADLLFDTPNKLNIAHVFEYCEKH